MDKHSRRRFTKEFKAETVALIRQSGKSIAEVGRDMGLSESSVQRWLAQAEMGAGQRDGLTTAERDELFHMPARGARRAVVCHAAGLWTVFKTAKESLS